MNLDKLFELIKNCLQGKTFTLTADYLDAPKISQLLNRFFTNGQLIMTQVKEVCIEEDKVVVRPGFLTEPFLSIEQLTVDTVFYLDKANIPQIILTCRKEMSDYSLATSFPVLGNSPLSYFQFAQPVFTLESAIEENKKYLELQQKYADYIYNPESEELVYNGLHFSGKIALNGNHYGWLLSFLPDGIDIAGEIQLLKDVPRMCLQTTLHPFQLGPFGILLQLEIITLFGQVEEESKEINYYPWFFNTLTTTLEYAYSTQDLDKLKIPIQVQFNSLTPTNLVFESDLAEASVLGLQAFSKLLSGIDLLDLTNKLPAIDSVILDKIRIDFAVEDLKINSLQAIFKLNQKAGKLELIHDLMAVDQMELDVLVEDPFTENLQVSAQARGAVDLYHNPIVMGGIDGELTLPEIDFACGISPFGQINISEIFNQLLPSLGIPQIICDQLEISGSLAEQKCSFKGNISSKLTVPLGILDVTLENLGFEFGYARTTDSVEARLIAELNINDTIKLLTEGQVDGSGWQFAANFSAAEPITLQSFLPKTLHILPSEIIQLGVLGGSFILNTHEKSLDLTLMTSSRIDFGPVGSIDCNQISLSFKKGSTDGSNHWEIKTTGHLKLLDIIETPQGIQPVVDLAGTLSVTAEGDTFKLIFKADGEGNAISLPTLLPGQDLGEVAWIHYQLKEVSLEKKEDWHFRSKFGLYFTQLHDLLQLFLPTTQKKAVEVELSIGKESSIELDALLDFTFPAKIPEVPEAQIPAIDLGIGRLKVGSFKFSLGKKIEIASDISFYLPSRFNYIFGEDQGKPRLVIFDTFDPKMPDESKCVDIHLYAKYGETGLDVGAEIKEMPTNFVEVKDGHCNIILGRAPQREEQLEDPISQYGFLQIDIPKFSFTDKGLELSGGFRIIEELKIPLKPLQQLLQLMGIELKLPDAIPVPMELNPFIDESGKLNVAMINEFFQYQLPSDVINALEAAKELVDRLPSDFTKYLRYELPKDLQFAIKISADAGCDIKLKSESGIKVLLPQPSPIFMGIHLKEFSLGEMLAGQLISVTIDADFDTFDVVTLVASILAHDFQDYIGVTDHFRSRLFLHNLWLVIFYQTSIPIPIPLFFDKIGIDYYGLGDITVQSSFEFPCPSFDLRQLGEVFTDIVKFVTDPKAELSPRSDVGPAFTIGPNYIKTGKAVGEQLIGFEQKLKISPYQLLAYLLNAIKFFNFAKFLRSIPQEVRVNQLQTQFSIFDVIEMQAGASWMITDPQEFITENFYQKFLPTKEAADRFLGLLLKDPDDPDLPITVDDQGLLVFLKGHWNASLAGFDVGFGMVATDGHGFRMGFFLDGFIINLLTTKVKSYVEINPQKEVPFRVYGEEETTFYILGMEVFRGETKLAAEGNKFFLSGTFDLFDKNSIINIYSTSKLTGGFASNFFSIQGEINARLIIFTGNGTLIIDSNQGVQFHLEILSTTYAFSLWQEKDTLLISGQVPIGLDTVKLETSIDPIQGKSRSSIDGTIAAQLFRISATIYSNLNQAYADAGGTCHLYFIPFGNEVLSGHLTVRPDSFGLAGNFKLFPDYFPFNLAADVGGSIGVRFLLTGNVKIYPTQWWLGWMPTLTGTITISDYGLKGEVSIWGIACSLELRVEGDVVKLIGQGANLTFCIMSVFPFFTLTWS